MARVVFMSTLGVLAACQRPLPTSDVFEPVALLPLTVEQALPADVSPLDVRVRGGCYYYRHASGFTRIETNAAPDAAQRCAA